MTVKAQDAFTGSGLLTSHTPDVGGSWQLWTMDSPYPAASELSGGSLIGHSAGSSGAGAYYTCIGSNSGVGTTSGDADHLLSGAMDGDYTSRGGVWFRSKGDGTDGGDFYFVAITSDDSTNGLYRKTGGVNTLLASWASGPPGRCRVRVSGVSPTSIKARWWSGAEPGTWDIDTTDNTAANQTAAGRFGVFTTREASPSGFWGDDYLVDEAVAAAPVNVLFPM